MDESFRNMSARTRSFQQRNTLKLAHIVFSPASIRKRPAHMETSHGNPFWCNAFLAMTNHHMILFVSLLLFLPVFLRCVFSKVTRLLAVAATCLSQTWSVRSTVSFRFCSKNFHLNLTMKSLEKLLPNWSNFVKKKKTANSIDLWLKREPPLLGHFCVSHHSTDL